MALLPLRELHGWALADPSQDIRGLKVLDSSGTNLGTLVEYIVNTLSDTVEHAVTDTGEAFPLRDLELAGTGLRVKEEPW